MVSRGHEGRKELTDIFLQPFHLQFRFARNLRSVPIDPFPFLVSSLLYVARFAQLDVFLRFLDQT